jgi:hypothetical protein
MCFWPRAAVGFAERDICSVMRNLQILNVGKVQPQTLFDLPSYRVMFVLHIYFDKHPNTTTQSKKINSITISTQVYLV